MRFFIVILFFGLSFSPPLFAKGPPPGTGAGDTKANIMIMLDESRSMHRRDGAVIGIHKTTFDIAVANNGYVFAPSHNGHRIYILDSNSLYSVKGIFGGYNVYNNSTDGIARFSYPAEIALDQSDSTDEFIYVANRGWQMDQNGFFNDEWGRYILKACTGIPTTTACPERGQLVAAYNGDNQILNIEVHGDYVYALTGSFTLYKLNKSDLSLVTSINISGSIDGLHATRDGIAVVGEGTGEHVYLLSHRRQKICKFNTSDLSNATFTGGSHCITGLTHAQGLAASGKTTATTTDDFLYVWRRFSSGTINKFNANTGSFISRFARRGTGAGKTNNVEGLDVDSSGNIFAPEARNNNARWISKFNSDGDYVDRSPNPRAKRMEIAKLAIRSILTDPELTAGANFGFTVWGKNTVIHTDISSTGASEIISTTLPPIRHGGPGNHQNKTWLGNALEDVRTQYWHNPGRSPLSASAPCQGNFNLIISDGAYFGSRTPETELPLLSNVAAPLQPVKSFIVGLGSDVASGGTSTKFRNLATEALGDTTPPGALFASDVGNLTQRLRTAILSAISGNLTFTSPKVDFSSTPNGYICQPSFEYEKSDQWKGLLVRHEINADGSIADPEGLDPNRTISFHKKLNGRTALVTATSGRKVWTIDDGIENPTSGTYKNNNFDPDYDVSGETLVEASTQGLMMEGTTHLGTRDIARIMKFMRGHDMFDQDSDCGSIDAITYDADCYTEDKGSAGAPLLFKLHDFYNSTPAYIGPPSASASSDVPDTEAAYRYSNGYNAFRQDKKNRQNTLIIGSNGGMIHAFDNGCQTSNATCPIASNPGSELWAFVPPAILKNFRSIVSSQIKTELDGNVSAADTASITVNDTGDFPSTGVLRINEEFISYTGKTDSTFTDLTRGYDCGVYCDPATTHTDEDTVYNETTVRKPQFSVYGVDGPVVAKDIYTDGKWKTVVMVGFGLGGRGYTALDVTNPDNPIHMFTILNDIRGPGLSRSVKLWQTTYDASSDIHNTELTDYTYDVATEQTEITSAVNDVWTADLNVLDASAFKTAGYATVENLDGTSEAIFYESKVGNKLINLIRDEDSPISIKSGALIMQDSECEVLSSAVPAEYDYTRLALTTSMPNILNIKVNGVKKWVAAFGGGQNYGLDCTTGNVVYVMDLEDSPGQIIKQIAIPDDPDNSIYNTVNANLAVIQRDNTIKADYYGALAYVVDYENKLWKIDLTDNAGSELGRKIKLFEDLAYDTGIHANGIRTYQEVSLVLDGSEDIPITTSSIESNILRLYWGTGNMDNLAERNDIHNRLYGISDMTFMNFGLSWQTATDTTDKDPQYAIGDCTDSTSLSKPCIQLNNVGSNKNIGWYIDLPLSRKVTGRKVLYDKEQVYFVIYEPTTKLCSPGDAILGTYGYMCPNYKRLVVALGAGLGTGATTQGSQIYIGVSNADVEGTYDRGEILEQTGSGFGVSGSASAIAQDIETNPKGTNSIIVLSPVGTSSTGSSSIDAWRHYSGENYFDD